VGRGREYEDHETRRQGFTDPDAVERFVAETGVDLLAIAIGTAHGLYAGDPQLDFDLLREIRARVDLPLVLHGGSGVTEEQFRTAIAGGISKINVATDLFVTTGRRLVEAAQAEGVSYFALTQAAVASFEERCGYYLDLFGASGNA
jgi:fructose-bisphosphate aldolase class II